MTLQTSPATLPLDGKTAVVTGSSRGIGRAIALRLGQDGANVVVNYHSNAAAAAELVSAIGATGAKAVAVRGDIAVRQDVEQLFAEAQTAFGSIDILVHNAGTDAEGAIADLEEDVVERTVDLNFKGALHTLQQAARQLRDGGRIINISTGYTRAVFPGFGLYGATKIAVEQLVLTLSKELGGRGITANSVLPGVVRTDRTERLTEQFDTFAAMTPLGRIGEPEDIADVVAFLAGDRARWVTGQSIAAAGGLV
ncbi:SDR family oxidoreductase [Streptomyces sp. NPDC021093]|uniref:SDR family oxidoreductase n=1 Tax=Streptomyces sp. NPDC021093 TaxID=3365112 RepID=UPI00378986AB